MVCRSRVRSSAELVGDVLVAQERELRAFVRARVPLADVDDVLQTAAIRAVERAASLEQPERVVAWLYRLHRNVITDALRKRGSRERREQLSADTPEVVVEPPQEEQCACSLVLARRMSPAYATILSLVDVGGASISEAAQTLAISANNATVRLHRARKALRQAMLEHCGVDNPSDCANCRCVYEGCCVA